MKRFLASLAITITILNHATAQWTTRCGAGDGMVVDLASYDASVYATGFFTNICGATASHIARWDGASWHPVGTGIDDAGHKIAVIGTQMFLCQYKQAIDSNWLRLWNGSSFVKYGEGVYLTTASGFSKYPNLYDVVSYRGRLVVSGEFDRVGDKHISGIMQWNGSSWDSLGAGLSGATGASGVMYPHRMLVHDTSLYIVGNFTTAGGVTVNGVARWDGTTWHAMDAGLNGNVYGIGLINGEIYVGGDFTASGTTALARIAKWNGTKWEHPGFGVTATGPGAYAYVHTIGQVGSHGIFEGGFDHVTVGGTPHIANNVFAYSAAGVDTMDGGIPTANFEGLLAIDTATVLVGGALFPGMVRDTTNVSEYHFRSSLAVLPANTARSVNQLFPNPCSNTLNIAGSQKHYVIEVYDLLGRQLISNNADDYHYTINTADLQSGIYLLRLSYPNGSSEYKKFSKL